MLTIAFLCCCQQLLHFLQEFSQQTISRTHEIKKQLDGLISETKATDCRLHNVFNDFLMLSNTQFIENVSVFSYNIKLELQTLSLSLMQCREII